MTVMLQGGAQSEPAPVVEDMLQQLAEMRAEIASLRQRDETMRPRLALKRGRQAIAGSSSSGEAVGDSSSGGDDEPMGQLQPSAAAAIEDRS